MKTALIVKVCVPAILLLAAAIFVAHSQQQPPPAAPPASVRALTPNDVAIQHSVHTVYVSPTTDIK